MKKSVTLLLLLLPALITVGQDTSYFDDEWIKVSSMRYAKYYKILVRDQADTNRATESTYFNFGQIKELVNYSNYSKKTIDGKYKEWYGNGKLKREIDYKDGKKNGQLLTYWDNGKPRRIDTYENNKLIKGKCLSSNGEEVPYYEYERMPAFPGGIDKLVQYLSTEIQYPKKSRKKGIEGLVIVGFIVNEDGSISEVKILQGVNDELDNEAMRVVSMMPKWTPGAEDGKTLRVSCKLPIRFKLE